jgi:hypothetical protein
LSTSGPHPLGHPALASTIYGTVLATSIVAGLTEDEDYDELAIAIGVVVTCAVFALAHAHAELFAERYAVRRPLRWAEIRTRLSFEWPIVTAALPLAAIMLLGELDFFSREAAEALALGAGAAGLLGLSLELGRRENLGLVRLVGVTALNLSFAAVIVALKVLVH